LDIITCGSELTEQVVIWQTELVLNLGQELLFDLSFSLWRSLVAVVAFHSVLDSGIASAPFVDKPQHERENVLNQSVNYYQSALDDMTGQPTDPDW